MIYEDTRSVAFILEPFYAAESFEVLLGIFEEIAATPRAEVRGVVGLTKTSKGRSTP
jgi:hypothetical protein